MLTSIDSVISATLTQYERFMLGLRHVERAFDLRERCISPEAASPDFHAKAIQTATRGFLVAKHSRVACFTPVGFKCPITLDLFKDPVIALDGVSYERSSISAFLANVSSFPVKGPL
eukprot:9345001-Karenia_brevis.AAC.1